MPGEFVEEVNVTCVVSVVIKMSTLSLLRYFLVRVVRLKDSHVDRACGNVNPKRLCWWSNLALPTCGEA